MQRDSPGRSEPFDVLQKSRVTGPAAIKGTAGSASTQKLLGDNKGTPEKGSERDCPGDQRITLCLNTSLTRTRRGGTLNQPSPAGNWHSGVLF